MIIKIIETINNTYSEQRELIKSNTTENLMIYPENGYIIRNKKTGQLIDGYVVLGVVDSIDNYEEIEDTRRRD